MIKSIQLWEESFYHHDHLTWTLIGIYDGEEQESYYRRIDDGSNPKVAVIDKVSERINKKGYVTVLGKDNIHRIENIWA